MTSSPDCKQNRDPLKPVREGTSQEQRLLAALDPGYAQVDGRTVADGMVFARAYSAFLNYFNADNAPDGDWRPFFDSDLSVQLAVAAVQDVDLYRTTLKEFLDFLKDLDFQSDEDLARTRLGYLFSAAGTLARQLDLLKERLPADTSLKGTLRNLVQGRLAPALQRLISYYKADLAILPESERLIADLQPGLVILGSTTVPFGTIYQTGLSADWITDSSADWGAYTDAIAADASVYGQGIEPFRRINHIATHNLFTAALDQFLGAYARVAKEGRGALDASLTGRDDHEPHYALLIAFLRLFDRARAEANTLTGRHLDFYYREVLRLREKEALAGQAHLLVELAKQAPEHLIESGEPFKAGKDDTGKETFFANDRDFVANRAKVAQLKTVYRHGTEKVGIVAPSAPHQGRLYASPAAASEDGRGGEPVSEDRSWHPLHNKRYRDGGLVRIDMPKAEIGFAVASHYLYLAGGERTVTLRLAAPDAPSGEFRDDVVCMFTSAEGWLERKPASFSSGAGGLKLEIVLSGADPAVVSYAPERHGSGFAPPLPVLLVKLKHREGEKFVFPALEEVSVTGIELTVEVEKLKSATLANDFGPVDASKPFQPFGASPVVNGSFVIGSEELFRKKLDKAHLNLQWQSPPAPFGGKKVEAVVEYLQAGAWRQYKTSLKEDVTATRFTLLGEPESPDAPPYRDAPGAPGNERHRTSSRDGFVRLRLEDDFGRGAFEQALIDYIKRVTDTDPDNDGEKPIAPTGPFVTELTLDYAARQVIPLDAADGSKFQARQSRFYHVAPFGSAEEHPFLKAAVPGADPAIYLLPQFKHANRDDAKLPKGHPVRHEAELLIGVADLAPPQNIALLFQVVDGSADPRALKPRPHIHWSYLSRNEWLPFGRDQVEDRTGELLKSGIVTFAVPRDASGDNTLLPAGMHWIKAAVAEKSDSACRLVTVAAQALKATFADRGNDPSFAGKPLAAGTIGKLERPDAAVKKISQPFAGFGGRGKEAPAAFHARVSERLRHKDRAIAQWDYERLVLEAFPQIYRAKCLNHTEYEPDQSGSGIYRELAPGHVTVVTIPSRQFTSLRDPLRPFTSLGLLEEIALFLRQRLSCFVQLHVKNPEFEEVQVVGTVTLHEGLDETFFEKKMQEEVIRFLSPWAYPGGGNPSFGDRVGKSVLIDFLEELPFVDCVTGLRLLHSYRDLNGNLRTDDVEEAAGSKAVSVLVSAREHRFSILNPAEEETPGEACRCTA